MSTEDHKLKPPAGIITNAAENRLSTMISLVNKTANEAESHAERVDARLRLIEEIDLPGKVMEMSRILSGLAQKEGSAALLWNWPVMDAEQTYNALHHLVNWRETILRRFFPRDYYAVAEPCWLSHPDVLHLMGALCGMWHWAHTEADRSVLRQSEWLVRWKPLLVKDIEQALEPCRAEQQHVARRDPVRPIDLDGEQKTIANHVQAMQARQDREAAEQAAARAAGASTGG
ncbi:hypothetical protein ACGF07_34690 [Kitasatospora sp. NPDC048194]|uniref:hypothetical protein n=1 Tax=Kitasatospora sp. NPDC048194 TaxID=3364045 RepID=UPI003717C6A6